LQVPSHLDTQVPEKSIIVTPPRTSRRGVLSSLVKKGISVVAGHLIRIMSKQILKKRMQ